jgi:hypothetical protein
VIVSEVLLETTSLDWEKDTDLNAPAESIGVAKMPEVVWSIRTPSETYITILKLRVDGFVVATLIAPVSLKLRVEYSGHDGSPKLHHS